MLHFYHFGEIYQSRIPESDISKGKFVQIVHQSQGTFMLLAPKELCTFHAEIVNLFCETIEPNWAFELNSKSDNGILYEPEAKIIGGGFYEILEDQKRLNLGGASLAFGDYEAYGFDQQLAELERFQGYKIFC